MEKVCNMKCEDCDYRSYIEERLIKHFDSQMNFFVKLIQFVWLKEKLETPCLITNHILNQYEKICCQKEKEKCRKCDNVTANEKHLKVHVDSV